ncbi:hypothetical protein NM688_g181 [Phlebia brevispora]|uniref:Uncharacterized protein n=1 Tax=Phlebia brevispora TaxID=194682 RepID=A0ACC1TFB8_9APHY|nr:hypothetical protein NM688_g181 [Phlebia brevispora]
MLLAQFVLGTLLSGILWLLWSQVRRHAPRSSLDNIPGPPSPSFLTGNLPRLFHKHAAWAFHKEIAEKYGSVVKLSGLFGKKALYVHDPKALYSILVKEQDTYERAPVQLALNDVVLGPGLLSATGDRHRLHRKLLNPAFSIAHLRDMTPVFHQTMQRLRDGIMAQIKTSSGEVDVLTWMGRAALELVGQGGLGYSFDPLVADMEDTYGHALKMIQPTLMKCRAWMMLSPYYRFLGPPWLRRFLARLVPDPNFQRLKKLTDDIDISSRAIYFSKKALVLQRDGLTEQKLGRDKDIMSLLLKANLEAPQSERLTEEEVIAQMSTMVIAATDTTSNALAHALQLLAEDTAIQTQLRNELLKAGDDGDLPYDRLMELPLLDAVCRETLRLYPPVAVVTRQALQDAVLPLSTPIRTLNSSYLHEIFISRGTQIIVGSWMSNVNKELWGEDADEWKPERWLSPLPEALKSVRLPSVYTSLMTFVGGSRACIGFKFSELEMKVALYTLLRAFKFQPSGKTIQWNFAGLSFPTVVPDDSSPSLPLMVETFAKEMSAKASTVSIEILATLVTPPVSWASEMQKTTDIWTSQELKDEHGTTLYPRPHWAKQWEDLKVHGKDIKTYLKEDAYEDAFAEFRTTFQQIDTKRGSTVEQALAIFGNRTIIDLIFN